MYDYLVSEYINKLSLKQIEDFAFKQGIELTKNEKDIIYKYIKEHWRTFMYGNPRPLFDELKNVVRPITYNKIEKLYVEAKKKFMK